MNSFKTAILRIIASVMILLVYHIKSVHAEKIVIQSSLNLKSEYSDNISFEREEKNIDEDLIYSISPSINFSYSTGKTSLYTNLLLDILRYETFSEGDRENQDYRIGGSHRITERLKIGGNASYRLNTTQEDTGEVTRRQDNHRYAGTMSLYWNLTELSAIGMNYSYLKMDFEDSNSERHTLSFPFRRSFNNGLDVIRFSPKYTYRDSDTGELDSFNLSIGWSHRISERIHFNASLGGRYSEDRPDGGDTDSSHGIVAGINATWKSETGGMKFGYTRDLFTNTSGNEREVDRFTYTYNRRLLPRIYVRLLGNLYFRRQPDGDSGSDVTYYTISPTLRYKLTETHNLELGYSYTKEKDDALEINSSVDENSVWLKVIFNHQKIW